MGLIGFNKIINLKFFYLEIFYINLRLNFVLKRSSFNKRKE